MSPALSTHRRARSQPRHTKPRRGFTMLELIVVIVVLGVLSGIAVVSYGSVTDRAQDRSAASSLTAIARSAQALQAFENTATWDLASLITSISETTAAAPGVVAAAALVPVTGVVPASGQVAYALSADMTVAGLAMHSATGNLCVVRVPLTGSITSTCVPADQAGTDPAKDVADGTIGGPASDDGDDEDPVVPAPAPVAGHLYAWGANGTGALGDDSTTTRRTPVPVIGLPDGAQVVQVAVGTTHTVAVTTAGEVYSWGSNLNGWLGDGTTTQRNSPVQVRGLLDGKHVVQVAAAANHTVAVTSDGVAYAWGNNSDGRLGDGTIVQRNWPVQVGGLLTGKKVVQVAAGAGHTVAVTEDGDMYAWGSNISGQLGDGTKTQRLTPVRVAFPAGVKVAQVAAHSSTVAVTTDGIVYAWGANSLGQLGDGTTTPRSTPVQVRGLLDGVQVTQASAGEGHTLVVTIDGVVYAWGDNTRGQLGDGASTSSLTPVRVEFPAEAKVAQVSAGQYHTVAVDSDGIVYAWGYDPYGRLGDGTTALRYSPAPVAGPLAGKWAVQAVAGTQHTMAIAADR